MDSACGSIAYAEQYTECLFLSLRGEDYQLYVEGISKFGHWDLGCVVD